MRRVKPYIDVSAVFFILLFAFSCSKYSDYANMNVDGDKYRPYATFLFHNNDGLVRKWLDNGVVVLSFSNGPLYCNKTEDLFSYYVSFEAFVREDKYVEGEKVSITGDFHNEEWYNINPKDITNLDEDKVCLWVDRSWQTGVVSKSAIGTNRNKRFSAIDGWIRVKKTSTSDYRAEYECTVVANDDGEVMHIRGYYE